MITLTQEEVEEFKTLWLKKHGKKLTDEQAKEQASRLIRQFSFFRGMILEHS